MWGPRREGRQPRTVPHGLTHAEAAGGVQRQAAGALTPEGAGSVEAAPIGTDPGEDFALIHIWAGMEKGERQGLELPRWGFRTPRLSSGRRKWDSASFGGWGISGKTPRKGNLYLDLKRLQDPRHPPRQAPARVQLAGRGEPQRGRELPSQVSPVMRAKPRAQAGSVVGRTRVGTGVTFSIQTPVLSTGTQATTVATPGRTPRAPPPGGSRGITGLAAFARAPPGSAQGGAALGPQGGSAQVRFTAAVLDLEPAGAPGAVCGGGGHPCHLPAHTCTLTHRSPAFPRVGRGAGQQGRGCSTGLGASHLDTRCRTAPAGCRGRIHRHRNRPGSGTDHLHTGWTGTH